MPIRWLFRLGELKKMIGNMSVLFQESLNMCEFEYENRQLAKEFRVFLCAFKDRAQLYANKWLTTPLVLHSIGTSHGN